MDFIADSDDENSLPVLSPDCVDKEQLRDVFSILSDLLKTRIRAEAQGTPMESVYDEIESGAGGLAKLPSLGEESEGNEHDGVKESTVPLTTELQHTTALQQDAATQNATELQRAVDTSGSRMNESPPSQNPQQGSSFPGQPTVSGPSAIAATESPLRGEPQLPNQYSSRSLRKRTFASKHPYIADQADWLGICSVDGINEMFSDQDDITKVIRALNRLYMKRKERYPDEDRYKARDFYAHLGRSKLLALTGDPDVASQDTESQPDQEENNYESEEDEQLIPYEGFIQPEGDNQVSSESESVSEQSSDEEQLIRIGGRYRKLSLILRGVLPESAKRLSMFQEKTVPKKRRSVPQVREPRKGLGVKKFGSVSAQSEELQKELALFNDKTEGTAPSPLMRSFSDLLHISEASSSDSDTDSVEEVFSDSFNGTFTLSAEPSYLYVDSDSAAEADHMNYMLSAPLKRKLKGTNSGTRAGTIRAEATKNHGDLPKRSLSDVTNVSRQSKRRYSRKGLGTLKKRKLSSLSQPRFPKKGTKLNGAEKGWRGGLKSGNRRNERGERDQKGRDPKEGANEKRNADTRADTKDKKKKVKHSENFGHQGPIDLSFRRNPTMATTVIEEDSTTHFVHNRSVRGIGAPDSFMPTKESLFGTDGDFAQTELLPTYELCKVETIGDGHIFFSGDDSIVFTLVGKKYSLGLYRLEASTVLTEKYFFHLRRLVLDAGSMLNPSIREEIHHSLKLIVKWILIMRRPALDVIWKQLNSALNDFTKLQTREMRQYQCIVFARLLFVFHIYLHIEATTSSSMEQQLSKSFDCHTADFWSVFLQSYSAVEVSREFAPGPRTKLVDSLGLMYSMSRSKKHFWWPPINEALHDSVQVVEDKDSLLDVVYILASIVSTSTPYWGCFLTVLSELKSEKTSLAYHHFIDICVLASQRLGWTLEERVITQLYSVFAQRRFGNFSDELSVPQALGQVCTRMDIPESSLFERFMGVLYNYVSDISSKKDVKKLISKLVASSQYQYHLGRKYQIQFVNRLNLITLLYQISDVDLSTPFVGLVEQVADSKDMFVYGRTMDALTLISDLAYVNGTSVPFNAFEILLSRFCHYYADLFGMPNLLRSSITFVLGFFRCEDDLDLYRLIKNVGLSNFPDSVVTNILSNILLTTFAILTRPNLSYNDTQIMADFQRSLINYIGSQMGRLPVSGQRKEKVEEIVEISIQIWMICASITGTQHWNVIMRQKYSYIGNAELREHFVPLIAEEYMKSGPLDASIIGEIDTFMLKGLASHTISKYIPPLFSRLCQIPLSIFCFKKLLTMDLSTLARIQALRSQLMSSIIQNICNSSSAQGSKVAFIRSLVDTLRSEYSKHFTQTSYVDFCKQIVDKIQKSAKSLVDDMDEFWQFSVTLGFPNKRMRLAWRDATEIERLQMLNNEFLDALQYKKDVMAALDDWVSMSQISVLFSLVQLYISAAEVHRSHWAHLSHLLEYVWQKLQNFQIPVQESSFKLFLDLLVDLAMLSTRWVNDSFSIFELEALITCTKMFEYSFLLYDGYRDKKEFVEIVYEFIHAVKDGREYEEYLPFTNISFGLLRATSHSSYQPSFQHSVEDYDKAYQRLDHQLLLLLRPNLRHTECEDFDLSF